MLKIVLALCLTLPMGFAAEEAGFTPLFDGKTLNGWKLVGGHGPGYVVQDNKIVCPAEGIRQFRFSLRVCAHGGRQQWHRHPRAL